MWTLIKKSGLAILSVKIEFKANKFTRDKIGHYIMVKELIYQEDTAILNVHASN